jgi:hypothetical protein
MPLTKNQKTELDNLLNKGDAEGAARLLAGVAGIEIPADAKPKEPEPPPPPRTPQEVMTDLFVAIHQLLGNTPALTPLVNELKEVTAPPAAEEAPEKKP